MRGPSGSGRIGSTRWTTTGQHLRRLAVHDERCSRRAPLRRARSEESAIDERTAALVRVAATIAVNAASSSFQRAVAHALAAGVTPEEIVATLEAVTPMTGAARVVQCAPKIALALDYDVDAALERHDP